MKIGTATLQQELQHFLKKNSGNSRDVYGCDGDDDQLHIEWRGW